MRTFVSTVRSGGLVFVLAAAYVLAGCTAPTQHTGKRPLARRVSEPPAPTPSLEERMAARAAGAGDGSDRAGVEVPDSQQILGDATTHRYHRPDCALITDVPRRDRVVFVSPYDALDGGYAPCPDCRPGP